MSKLFTKTLSVILVAAMLLSCVIANAATPEENELVPSAEAYQYLWEQGFPPEVVETLSAENIMEIYNGQYELESVSITYGIFTESDSISYEINQNGDIVMDSENRTLFNTLLQDNAKIQKILHDKFAASTNELSAGLAAADLSANIKTLSIDAVIRALTNWSGMMTTININTSLQTMIKKQLIYSWHWNYNPPIKLEDQFAMAWGESFAYLPDTVSVYYCATNSTYGVSLEVTGNPQNSNFDFTPNCGFGVRFSLMSSIPHNGQFYTPTKHRGNIKSNIVKYIPTSEIGVQHAVNTVGKYFHKTVTSPSGTLTLLPIPSISISLSTYYDSSPNTPGIFYYYN